MNTTSSRYFSALVALVVMMATLTSFAQSREEASYLDSVELPAGWRKMRLVSPDGESSSTIDMMGSDEENLMVYQQTQPAKIQRGSQACRGTGSCTVASAGKGYKSCGGDGACTAPNAGSGSGSCSGAGSCTGQGSGRGRNSCSGTGSCTGVNSGRCPGSCTQTGSCTSANSCN